MSYSRWLNSIWYTFWRASDATCKEDEIFCICGVTDIKYKDMREDLEGCISKVKDVVEHPEKEGISFCPAEVSPLDYDELKIYMQRFMQDIEQEYECKNPH